MSGARRPPAARSPIVALALACAVWAQPAMAMSNRDDGSLSPRLAELAKPSVRGLSHAAQARKVGVAVSGPGSLVREGNRVLVEVGFDHGAISKLDALRAAGGQIVAASSRYQTVTVAVPPGALHELAGVAGVSDVSEVRAPIVYGSGEPATSAVGAKCEGGSVVSEGLDQLHVKDAWGKYGVDGAGVTVGVLSNSYDKATHVAGSETQLVATHAKEDVESGDLPGPENSCPGEETPVDVLEDFTSPSGESTDEGRAMLQTVHDVAPAAHLAFATAFKGETAFAENIVKLKESGAKVIADDVAYFEEPFFQDGPVAVAVDKVASEGVSYFSAAGNDNLLEGEHEIASWEAPSFRDTSCPTTVQALLPPNTAHCMNFNPSGGTDNTFDITVEGGETLRVDLQWAEPWYGVHTDLDAYLLDSTTGKLLKKEDQNNAGELKPKEGGTQKPIEVLQWENKGATQKVNLVINRCFGECNPEADETKKPRLKFALFENGSGVTKTEYPESKGGDTVGPTIFGHTAAAGAVSVAAIRYSNNEKPERFSSRGPVKHFFGPVSENKQPAAEVPEEVIEKPDITATDCGATTFFATFVSGEATWRFCGTSAAAPHAAGVAALELQAKPSASVAEVRSAQTSTASAIGSFGLNAVGAGLLNADSAVKSLLPPSAITITEHPSSWTADSTPTFKFTVSPPDTLTCSIDAGSIPGPTQPCSSEYTVASPLPDGPYTFKVKAAGGDEALFAFTVDTTSPTIAFAKQPGPFSSSATPTFAFSTSEPVAFKCALDGPATAAKPCASPFTTPVLAEGPHTLVVTATDQVGNESNLIETEFVVDTVAPAVTFTDRPSEMTTESTPTFGFEASEAATFTCSLDEAPLRTCDSPFKVTSRLSDGPHTFEVDATDPAGNVGRASDSFTVDTVAPTVTFTGQPPERTNDKRPSFSFTASEPVTFTCALDGALPQPCQSPFTAQIALADGLHTLEVAATDRAGNVGRASDSFTVDTRRPSTFFAGHPRRVIRTRFRGAEATFRFGSNESDVTFVCKVDHGLLHFCNSTFSRRFHVGKNFVLVKARDAAGNVDSTPAVFRFKVKPVG